MDTIINQKDHDVDCIYVAIGQKASTVADVIQKLEETGAMKYTTVVAAHAGGNRPLFCILLLTPVVLSANISCTNRKGMS